MRKLTKEDILKGKDKRVELYISEYDAYVVIRPLTDGEITEILSNLENLPSKEDGTPALENIDLKTNLKLLKLAASKGLVEPQLAVDELEQMKFGVPEYIGMKVLEISGFVHPEETEKKS